MRKKETLRDLCIGYLNGMSPTKDQIPTSLCLVHGYHRKSAIRVTYGKLNVWERENLRRDESPG